MPRPKESVAEIEKQIDALNKKLKEAKTKELKKQAESARRRAEVAGNLVLKHLAEEPEGTLAQAFRDAANLRLTKASEREMFALPVTRKPAQTKGTAKFAQA